MKHIVFLLMILTTSCSIKGCFTQNEVEKQEEQKQCTKPSCPIRLSKYMCTVREQTLSGKINWERREGATGPYFALNNIKYNNEHYSYISIFLHKDDRATLWIGFNDSFDIPGDCVDGLYEYLNKQTEKLAAEKKEKLLNDFLDSIENNE